MLWRQQIEAALPQLLRYASALAGDGEIGAELVQETVLKALATRARPDDPCRVRPWLFRVLRNAYLDRLRRERRDGDACMHVEDLEAFAPGSAASAEAALINRLTVRKALAQLSPQQRDILLLVDVCGFTYAEVAEILGVPKGTVMSRLSRARAAMLDLIGRENVVFFETARRARKKTTAQ